MATKMQIWALMAPMTWIPHLKPLPHVRDELHLFLRDTGKVYRIGVINAEIKQWTRNVT